MSATTWLIYTGSAVAVIGIAYLVLTQTSWYKTRIYAVKTKQIFDKYNIEKKAEALQSVGQNTNPVLVRKPLQDMIGAYKGLIADLEKQKVPAKAQALHESSLTMHRESLSLYQMAAVGGFRQKSMMDKQKKLQSMQKVVQEKTEALYGKMKSPEEMTGFQGFMARLLTRSKKR